MLNKLVSNLRKLNSSGDILDRVAIGRQPDMKLSVILSIQFPVDTDKIENVINDENKLKYMLHSDFEDTFKSGCASLIKSNFRMFMLGDMIRDEDIPNINYSSLLQSELDFKCDIW